jgi:hypothetical protein
MAMLSNEPSSAVTVCTDGPLFDQVTVEPAGTVIVGGSNSKSRIATLAAALGLTGGQASTAGSVDALGEPAGATDAAGDEATGGSAAGDAGTGESTGLGHASAVGATDAVGDAAGD